MMFRRLVVLAAALCLGAVLVPGSAAAKHSFEPGAPGLGDEYFPLDGNGGYDVRHYDLDLAYDPDTDVLTGVATIEAKATQNLSRFNLDFDDLTVRSVRVNGKRATWTHADGELTITPAKGLRDHKRFEVRIAYDGVPQTLPDTSGFLHTDDGALEIGEPHGAATWYPANDYPTDKASYTISITVPRGLEAISNGELKRRVSHGGETTWTWEAREPMASYLAMMAVGEFDVRAYREDGIRYWDAVDPRLYLPNAPRTGDQFALSQSANTAYKRLSRTIDVPAGGGELSFWVIRNTEPDWDYFFVEAHPVGSDDWTTLPDANGHTSQETGNVCPFWLGLHPFLEHYQTPADEGCSPEGTTGEWHAASGASIGYEQWTVDLSDYAGQEIELSLSYASDDLVAFPGLFVDDIEGPGGQGSTSFEDDGDTMDGWAATGPPAGSAANPNNWIVGTAADAPPPIGATIDASLAQQPAVIAFESSLYGRYPFSAAGGIVDIAPIGFALENQTRPIYSTAFFTDPQSGEDVVVHELAHQWVGDYVTVARWRDIWINEGFATYTEWLWSEHEGRDTAQEIFDFYANAIPADDPFWTNIIGHPASEELLFDISVYYRGAMTLQALRNAVGDEKFFRLLRVWVRDQGGGHGTVEEFIATAERVTGMQLDDLFQTWLFTPSKPAGIEAPTPAARTATALLAGPAAGKALPRFPKR
jgi:Peptidase family M1 domain/Peptidase M1 N-terminal domain/Immune inhibitor A peptidase M6